MADQYQVLLDLPKEIERRGLRYGRRVLRRIGAKAPRAARAEFDRLSYASYSISGKSVFRVAAKRKTEPGGVQVFGVYASPKNIGLDRGFPTRPALTTNTTGSNRQPVYYSIKKGVWVYVDGGFIWDGLILRRKGPKSLPVERVTPSASAAVALGENKAAVSGVLEKSVKSAIDAELRSTRF